MKLLPVPDPGAPPGALQLKVTGGVPPVELAVQVTGDPTVPVAGQVMVTVRIGGCTVTVWLLVAVLALASVVVSVTVNVPPAV